MEERLVSNCCGHTDGWVPSPSTGYDMGYTWRDMDLCPQCKNHCEFITQSQREEEMKVEILTGKKDTNGLK
jgi:hypothetical protein